MAEEGTLALVRSNEIPGSLRETDHEPSKDELQHRMEVTRESISDAVEGIKDTMVNQYESVKETVANTLDWHEQVKKRPAAWSAGALGAGFIVGYGVAAVVKGPAKVPVQHYAPPPVPARASAAAVSQSAASTPGHQDNTPGLIQRLSETPAYDRVKQEAGVIGNRFVDEISKQAQQVVLPAVIGWLGSWLEGVLPANAKQSKAH
jgi:hypothetical protein